MARRLHLVINYFCTLSHVPGCIIHLCINTCQQFFFFFFSFLYENTNLLYSGKLSLIHPALWVIHNHSDQWSSILKESHLPSYIDFFPLSLHNGEKANITVTVTLHFVWLMFKSSSSHYKVKFHLVTSNPRSKTHWLNAISWEHKQLTPVGLVNVISHHLKIQHTSSSGQGFYEVVHIRHFPELTHSISWDFWSPLDVFNFPFVFLCNFFKSII